MNEGINPKDALGLKKPALHLVPPALPLYTSQVFKFSSVKYGPFNWREKKVRLSVYLDAIERHLLAMKDGQMVDAESGLPHAAHIAANVGIIMDAGELGRLVDDLTWHKGPAVEIIEKLTDKTVPATVLAISYHFENLFGVFHE